MRRGYTRKKATATITNFTHRILAYPYYRARLAIGLYLSIVAVGTVGYHVIEGWTWLDSIFMTIITLAAVGFGEVHDLDSKGKIFTVLLIIFGVSTAAWAIVTTFEVLGSEQGLRDLEKRRVNRMVNSMKDHFIICGYGRIGRSIVDEYKRNSFPFVVIEFDAARAEGIRAEGIPCLQGDASNDEILIQAGIARARGLIAVTPNDAINTYIVLSARWLNPKLMVVVRAINPDSVDKLRRAGATKVISPHILGGWWMALTAINPAATDFIEGLRLGDSSDTTLYEFEGGPGVDGKTFGEMDFKNTTGALVIAVRRTGEFIPNPPDDLKMRRRDAVIALGSVAQLEKLAKILDPQKPAPIQSVISSPDL